MALDETASSPKRLDDFNVKNLLNLACSIEIAHRKLLEDKLTLKNIDIIDELVFLAVQ